MFNGAGFSNLLNARRSSAPLQSRSLTTRAPGAPLAGRACWKPSPSIPTLVSEVEQTGVDFSANGNVVEFWGGPISLAWGGSTSNVEVDTRNVNYSLVATPVATIVDQNASQRTNALFAEVAVPLVGKANAKPLISRFEIQAAGRYEEVGTFSKSVPKLGFTWAPVQSLLLRASWSESFRAPWVTEYMVQQTPLTSTLTDPRRTPASTTGVAVTRGSNPSSQPELSESTFVGLVYEPKFAKGLSVQVNYYDTIQKDLLQLLSAQTMINNEALFADRITRAAPTAADTALNQPGQITAINRVFANFGRVVNRSMDVTSTTACRGSSSAGSA
jgi:iron complex outermembrane receptor protein